MKHHGLGHQARPEGHGAAALPPIAAVSHDVVQDKHHGPGGHVAIVVQHRTRGAKRHRRQIEGLRSVSVNRVVRRLPTRGPIAFGRALEITVDVDEMAFEGGSAFLLGAVLDRYFARYVSINSATETVLRSDSRGEINRWTPTWGTRPTL